MGYEIFVLNDETGIIGSRAEVVSLLEKLPAWQWDSSTVGRFCWPAYAGSGEEVVYVDDEDPCRSLMFERPSDLTVDMAATLAATLGSQLTDPNDTVFDNSIATATENFTTFERALWDAGVWPVTPGEPRWTEKLVELIEEKGGSAVEPVPVEDVAAAEERLGTPLPALLRTWYTSIGELGIGALDDLTVRDGKLLLPLLQAEVDLATETVDGSTPLGTFLIEDAAQEL